MTEDRPTPADAAEARPLIVAVASQNGRTVTPHAGKTRRFLLFTATSDGAVEEAGRFDLPKALAMHGWPHERAHPLFACDVVVAGSAGEPFKRRLGAHGVRVVVSTIADPKAAATLALAQ